MTSILNMDKQIAKHDATTGYVSWYAKNLMSTAAVALEVGFVKTLLAGSLVMHTSRLVD